jgi:hypothetical protein
MNYEYEEVYLIYDASTERTLRQKLNHWTWQGWQVENLVVQPDTETTSVTAHILFKREWLEYNQPQPRNWSHVNDGDLVTLRKKGNSVTGFYQFETDEYVGDIHNLLNSEGEVKRTFYGGNRDGYQIVDIQEKAA